MERTLCNYNQNNFAQGLYQYFNKTDVDTILRKYCVGTAKDNKTVFWQVNRKGEVRTGKIIQYNTESLKRTSDINWAHSKLNLKNFNLKQIYFGAHLLIDTKTPVAIAEGEKNAILGALHYPQYNWIAVGGIRMLNIIKLNALSRYDVTLFPDKGKAYDLWSEYAQKVTFKVKVDNTLEQTNLPEGSDVADLVIFIKRLEYNNSPKAIVDKLISVNPVLGKLIEKFYLVTE